MASIFRVSNVLEIVFKENNVFVFLGCFIIRVFFIGWVFIRCDVFVLNSDYSW